MRVEGVALIPTCAECGERWMPANDSRWAAYLTDDEPPELAFFCPDCAERAVVRGSFDQSVVKLVSPDDLERARRAMVRNGDILISRSNSQELVGRAAHVVDVEGALMYPDLLMRIRVDTDRVDPRFAEVWLRTQEVRNHLMRNATGTSPTMKKINQATVKSIPFPVGLSLEEQLEVVGEIARADEFVSAAREALEEIEEEAEAFERAVEAERLTPGVGDLIPA